LLTSENIDMDEESDGRTPIHLAVLLGRPLFVAVLLLKGVRCGEVIENQFGNYGKTTLLHLACRPIRFQSQFPNHDIYRFDESLKLEGPVPGPFLSELPLGCWKTLIRLLSKGFDINSRDENSITPIRYLIRAGGDLDRVRFLYDLGADLDIPDNRGEFVLHAACCNTDVPLDVVEFLVERSSPPILDCGWEPYSSSVQSPLVSASRLGNLAASCLLLAKGVRLTLRDKMMYENNDSFLEFRYGSKQADVAAQAVEELIVVFSYKSGHWSVYARNRTLQVFSSIIQASAYTDKQRRPAVRSDEGEYDTLVRVVG
jgi:ankyrin repeat protein